MLRDIENDLILLKDSTLHDFTSPSIWATFQKAVQGLLLPELSVGEIRPLEEGDFTKFREDVAFGLKVVCDFISHIVATQPNLTIDRNQLVWSLILCGEHSSSELWTTRETCFLSAAFVKSLCTLHSCTALSELVLGLSSKTTTSTFRNILCQLRPKLLQETWRRYPGAVSVYKWLVCEISSPYLSEYLGIISPTALIILDDHTLERRLIGLSCLSHIIDNVARTDLCQQGLHQVFYRALEPLLWQRNADQIEPVITCVTRLLSKTERGYTRSVAPGMWDLFDDTLQTLLDKMAFEDQIPLRKAYIRSLAPMLSAMGPSIIRWSKTLLSVFDEYLNKESFDTRLLALEALKIYILLSAPRLSHNGEYVLYLLLRTLIDVSSEEQDNSRIIEIITECITLVKSAAPSQFGAAFQELESLECNETMKLVLSKFINK